MDGGRRGCGLGDKGVCRGRRTDGLGVAVGGVGGMTACKGAGIGDTRPSFDGTAEGEGEIGLASTESVMILAFNILPSLRSNRLSFFSCASSLSFSSLSLDEPDDGVFRLGLLGGLVARAKNSLAGEPSPYTPRRGDSCPRGLKAPGAGLPIPRNVLGPFGNVGSGPEGGGCGGGL